ncbi:MAG: hypothetical protein SFU25_10615 [Candidatus Caenarcaniphilales bacterium]|nr:hypothetical protein [Candidatus Caenarcaniphilales bacterium]
MKKIINFTLALTLSVGVSIASLAAEQTAAPEATTEVIAPSDAAAKMLKASDKDNDGKLAANETGVRFRLKSFSRADKNKDGFLDSDELNAFFEKRQQYLDKQQAK